MGDEPKLKIVLFALNGSYVHTNLAVRCLREPLLGSGHEVNIIERNLRDRRSAVLHDLYLERADLYSFSVYIWNLLEMIEIAGELKKLLPGTRIVFGGPEASYETDRFDKFGFIDYIISGEGEISLARLCSEIEEGNCPKERIIKGIAKKTLETDGIFYDRDDLCLDGVMLYYESSRGCPYRCAYCLSSASDGIRAKSVKKTLEDLEAFEHVPHSFNIIKFVDRTFNFDVTRANAIWRALRNERFTKTYHFEICASLLNEESFEILASLPKGKIQLEIGLQSTNEQTLSEVSRHISPDKVIENVKRICAAGNIHVHVDLIAGLPYESFSRFGESFDALYGNCDMLQLGFLKLLPGTVLRNDADKYGYKYLSYPPYTVLESNDITYDEMHKLEDIAALLKRYYESGNFERSISYISGSYASSFAFYRDFADYIKENDGRFISSISQSDAYKHLYGFASTFCDGERLKAFLREDYSSSENRRLPSFLK